MTEMTVQEKRQHRRNEFRRKFGDHWLIYISLIGTATLSLLSGLFLPLQPDANGVITITFWTIMACLYYMVGFVSTGEGAGYYWFDKLTDHDKDNNTQVVIAGLMLFVSIVTIVVTALAGAAFVAFWLGAFEQFAAVPTWAQKWIVWAIPALWVAHAVAGMGFKAFSDEAEAERDAKASIRESKLKIIKDRADARADYWKANATSVAKQLGEMEAQEEIENFSVRLKSRRPQTNQQNPTSDSQKPQDERAERPATHFTTQEVLSKMGLSLDQARVKYSGRRYGDFAGDCSRAFADSHIDGRNMKAVFFGDINPTQAEPSNHRR